MDKKYLSKLTIGGNQYDLKDAEARGLISDIQSAITGAMHYIGTTTTPLTDGATTNPIVIAEENVTAVAGDVAIYGEMEYVFNGTKWQEFGSTGSLKALAFKDNATGDVECAGTNAASTVSFEAGIGSDFVTGFNVSPVAPSFTEGSFDAGSLPSFTEGAFSQGTLPSFTEGAFDAGSLPSLGAATTGSFTTEGIVASVNEANETLTFSAASTSSAVTAQGTFSAGSLPSKAADTWSAGTLPSKAADTFDAGSLPSKDADTWSAGTVPTLSTAKALTASNTGTAAAQVFSGATVSVTVA